MYRKHLFIVTIAIAILCLGGLSTMAQTGAVRGTIKMKQADGTIVPVANAIVDVYRLDVTGKREGIKASKNGEFTVLGLFIVGKYVLSISAPGAKPSLKGGIKAGQDVDIPIVMEVGDGRRYTMEQAIEIAKGDGSSSSSGGGGGGESAEDRAKRLEIESKNAEIIARNKREGDIDETIRRTFKAGRAARDAGKFDEAIAHYDEGLAAEPNQYTLLSDKAWVLKARGFNSYTESIKAAGDKAKRDALVEAMKKDLAAAVEASNKSYTLVMAESPLQSDQAAYNNYNANKLAILDIRAEVLRLHAVLVDQTQGAAAFTALEEYVAVEPNVERKLKTRLMAAEMLRLTGDWERASAEFKKILVDNPDNVEALRGVGLALFGDPSEKSYQEAVDYLQRFVDKALDTHADKADAKAIIEEMKKKDIKPQKLPTGRRRS